MPKKNFEKALEELENIVQRLEDSDMTLDKAMTLFEDGIKLSHFCTKKLEEAEKRVNILIRDENEGLKKTAFDKIQD